MAWDLIEKSGVSGGGWEYNDGNLAYNEDQDPDSLSDVTYNNVGTQGTWSNTNKS
jgi:hypothetical protein